MENSVIIFQSEEFGRVRTLANEQGDPLFCLGDVCGVLDLRSGDVVRRLDKGVVSNQPLQTAGGVQSVQFITEDGLYDAIFDSRKPAARKFRKWITAQVIPSIRKTGSYSVSGTSRPGSTPESRLGMELMFAERAASLLALNDVSKLSMMRTIQDKWHMPDMLPHYVKAKDAALSATQLLSRYLPGVSVREFNARMVELGFLKVLEHKKKDGRVTTFRSVTDAGYDVQKGGIAC